MSLVIELEISENLGCVDNLKIKFPEQSSVTLYRVNTPFGNVLLNFTITCTTLGVIKELRFYDCCHMVNLKGNLTFVSSI